MLVKSLRQSCRRREGEESEKLLLLLGARGLFVLMNGLHSIPGQYLLSRSNFFCVPSPSSLPILDKPRQKPFTTEVSSTSGNNIYCQHKETCPQRQVRNLDNSVAPSKSLCEKLNFNSYIVHLIPPVV